MLGPGALQHSSSMRPYMEGFRARGVEALAIDLPRGAAERAVPAFLAACPAGPLAAGGHSFGGRVASLAALEREFAGLSSFYPTGAWSPFPASATVSAGRCRRR